MPKIHHPAGDTFFFLIYFELLQNRRTSLYYIRLTKDYNNLNGHPGQHFSGAAMAGPQGPENNGSWHISWINHDRTTTGDAS